MKTSSTKTLLLLAALSGAVASARAQGTAFTYQGRLNLNGTPANGSYDVRFIPFNASDGGSQTGVIVTNRATPVVDGIFTTTLDLQDLSFFGTNHWIEIAVRTNGTGGFVTLSPRQPITPVPQAMVSSTAVTALSLADVTAYNFVIPRSGSCIGGGYDNTNLAHLSVIGGGGNNSVKDTYSFLGGGYYNIIENGSATLMGGENNFVSGYLATMGGGYRNTNSSYAATLAGGYENLARARYTTIAGGERNWAFGQHSAIGGGYGNVTSNYTATVPGGYRNVASGLYSFAAGQRAQALHSGSFVWADDAGSTHASTGDNQFCIRARGGVQLAPNTGLQFANNSRQKINLWGTDFGIGIQAGVQYARTGGGFAWYQGGSHADDSYNPGNGGFRLMSLDGNGLFVNNTFVSLSDRRAKAGFTPIDPRDVLEKVAALPITRWHYTNAPATTHLGPVAQDFHAAFGLGLDDKSIATVDADGVALAAIQGLNRKLTDEVQRQDREIKGLQRSLSELRSLVESGHRQLDQK